MLGFKAHRMFHNRLLKKPETTFFNQDSAPVLTKKVHFSYTFAEAR